MADKVIKCDNTGPGTAKDIIFLKGVANMRSLVFLCLIVRLSYLTTREPLNGF